MSGSVIVNSPSWGICHRHKVMNLDTINFSGNDVVSPAIVATDKNGVNLGSLEFTRTSSMAITKITCHKPLTTENTWLGLSLFYHITENTFDVNVGGAYLTQVNRLNFTNNSWLWIA